jgi:hypothetical protein
VDWLEHEALQSQSAEKRRLQAHDMQDIHMRSYVGIRLLLQQLQMCFKDSCWVRGISTQ